MLLPDPPPVTRSSPLPVVRHLGTVDYVATWQAMQRFTAQRQADTPDEIWCLQHPPVYTLGLNARHGEFANPDRIPVVRSDRGGDITYHGPGQLIIYVLVDLRRQRLGIKDLVHILEQTVIDDLTQRGIQAERRRAAPGVYVDGRKIAQLGLRVRGGASYHGLSLNVNMDLGPFERIRPCGYADLKTTHLAACLGTTLAIDTDTVAAALLPPLLQNLGYNSPPND